MPAPIPSIDIFKQKLAADGLNRGIFYTVTITFAPAVTGLSFDQDELVLCKALTLPSVQLDAAEIKYFTRTVKIPGSRQYSPITLSLYNTPSYGTRAKFLTWISAFNAATENARQPAARPDTGYYAEMQIQSYSEYGWNDPALSAVANIGNRELLGTYAFTYVYPTSVTAVQYSYENDTQPQTYDVELQYLDFTFETNT